MSTRLQKRLLRTGLIVLGLLASGTVLALPRIGNPLPGGVPTSPDGFVPRGSVQQAPDEPGAEVHELSAQEAARQAQSINGGGRVLSVDEASGGWRVKLLKDGNVRFVFVPD